MPLRQAIRGFFKGFQSGYTKGAANRREKEESEKAAALEAPNLAKTSRKKESSGIGCLLVLLILGAGVYALWHFADEQGYIPHRKLAIVTAGNWSTGEYKTCTSPNLVETKDEPQIDCSDFLGRGEIKKFEVRFFGVTYREDLVNVSFSWRCKKDDGAPWTFTCDEQKVIKWDEKK